MLRLALAALVIGPPLAAQQIGLRVGAASGVQVAPGATLAVPITVDLSAAGTAKLASLQSGMNWNAGRLAFDSIRLAVPGWTLAANSAAAPSGSMTFSASNATALPATATLVNAYFTAASAGGTRITLAPTAAGSETATSLLDLLRPTQLDVCVAVPGKWGDVTSDGSVNIIDAQRIARFSAGLSVSEATRVATAGDVTADGVVNVIDAQQIARYAVALSAAERVDTDVFTPPLAASIVLAPATPQNLSIGATLQLTATPRDASNADVTGCASVTWTSSNTGVATVSASGLVVASGAGSTTISARSATNAAVATSVLVNVASPAQTPIVFFTESFDAPGLGARGWYDNTNVPLSTTEKHAGASAAEYRFLAGARTPVSGGSIRRKFTPSNSVYISYWVKYSDNWVGSTWAYHPHEFHVMSNADPDYAGPGNAQLTLYVEHSYQNGNRPRLGMQDNKAINLGYGTPPINLTTITESRSVSGCNGVVESGLYTECFPFPNETPPWYNSKQILGPVVMQPTPGPGYKGNWNLVEAYFEMNTIAGGIGQPNGVIRYWFNGTPVIDRQDVLFRTGARPTLQFSQFVIAPYIGGVGSSIQQSMWVDDITVASGRIQ